MENLNFLLSLDKNQQKEKIFQFAVTEDDKFFDLLRENGINLDFTDENGNTLLHKIAENGNEKCFVSIATYISVDIQNNDGKTPLHFCVEKNNFSFAKLLLSNGANIISDFKGVNPIDIAEENKFEEIFKLLNKRMKTIHSSYIKLCNLIISQNIGEIKALIENGEYMNIKDEDGTSLLHFAVSLGNEKIVELLVDQVDINAKDQKGRTATQIAINNKMMNIAKLLILHGGIAYGGNNQDIQLDDRKESITNQNNNLDTPKISNDAQIFNAIKEENMEIIHNFALTSKDLNQLNENHQTPLLYSISLEKVKPCSELARESTVNFIDIFGVTSIFYAVSKKNLQIVRILIEKGANVMYKNPTQKTVIDIVENWKEETPEEGAFKQVMLLTLSFGLFNQPWIFLNFINSHDNLFNERQSDYLLESIRKEQPEILILLTEKNIDLNQILSNGLTPLHYAIKCGSYKSVDILIKTGKCELITINKMTEIDRCLLLAKKQNKGNSPHKLKPENLNKMLSRIVYLYETKLMKAIDEPEQFIKLMPKALFKFPAAYFLLKQAISHLQKDVVSFLIENGLSANCMDENGFTLLHYAAMIDTNFDLDERAKLLEIIIFLNKKGADKTSIDLNGRLALHYASEKGYPEIAAELAQKSLCFVKDLDGKTPLDLAKNKETLEVLTIISQRESEDVDLPEQSEEEMIKLIETTNNITTDMITVSIGKDYDKLMKVILDKGIQPNTKDTDGYYLLHRIVMKNAYKCSKVLLLYGANVNCLDKNHQTPLHISIANGTFEITKLLCECGAKNIEDKDGFYATDLLNKKDENVKQLSHFIRKYHILSRVLKHMFEDEYKDDIFKISKQFGFILLEKVVTTGNLHEIKELIQDFHISPNVPNPFGVTALHVACLCNLKLEVVETLINLGSKLNSKTVLGYTPLHFAVMKNNKELAKLLIKRGANTQSKNVDSKTPLDIANELGYEGFEDIMKTKKSHTKK